MSAQRSRKGVLETAVRIHAGGQLGSHEELDGQQSGLLSHAVLGWVTAKEPLPVAHVLWVRVGFNLASRNPDRVAVIRVGVGNLVTVGGHDAPDWTGHVRVGCVGEGCLGRFNGKGGNDAVEKKR